MSTSENQTEQEDRIEARARELAERCGCRTAHLHRPLARVQIDLEDAAAKAVGEL